MYEWVKILHSLDDLSFRKIVLIYNKKTSDPVVFDYYDANVK